jgi:hypothetical protein
MPSCREVEFTRTSLVDTPVVRGEALHEVHETLGLGQLVAHLEVLLSLNTQQHEGKHEEADPGIPPSGSRLVAQVEDAEDKRNQEQDNDCDDAPRGIGILVGDDVVEGVEIHAPSQFTHTMKRHNPSTGIHAHCRQVVPAGPA